MVDYPNKSNGLWRVGRNELENLYDVIETGFKGIYTQKFEEKFAEIFRADYAIALNSGTSALHCAVAALGISEGDEVIVPPLTFSATAFAPIYHEGIPVFADIDNATYNISAESIREKVTERTKAIITVSLFGQTPEMDEILEIASKSNLKVIEDNAQCVYGTYKGKLAGTFGDASIFSLQRSKHLTSGDGGVLTTSDPEIAEYARKFGDLGYSTLGASSGSHLKNKSQLQHPSFQRHDFVGYNFRMPELCAAVGLAQLEKTDMLVSKRRSIAEIYSHAVGGCEWLTSQYVPDHMESSFWAYALLISNSSDITWEQFRDAFLKNGGEDFYGAWSLGYLEPALKNKIFGQEQTQKYAEGLCPVAESVQPRLILLKTNFENMKIAKEQSEILHQTIHELS